MSNKRCVWGTCNSDSRYPDRSPGVKFVPFVTPRKVWNREKCMRWIKACGRPHEQLNIDNIGRSKFICTKHFVDGWPSSDNPDPVNAIPVYGKSSTLKRKSPKQRLDPPPAPKMRKLDAAHVLLSLQTEDPLAKQLECQDTDFAEGKTADNLTVKDSTPASPGAQGIGPDFAASLVVNGDESCSTVNKIVQAVKADYIESVKFKCDKCGNEKAITEADMQSMARFKLTSYIMKSDEVCYEYSGIPKRDALKKLFKWIEPVTDSVKNWGGYKKLVPARDARGRKRYKITAFECFLMTVVRIRKGFDVRHMSFLFGISASHVSRIFILWVNILEKCLKPLLKWPTQQVALGNLPKSFADFPRTRCIIDCTEFAVEKPFRPIAQKQTWSTYKHSNTTKLLVAIHPCGLITFISKLYVGSISDQEIVKRSGFLDLLEPNDDVMADRGFNIRHLLLQKRATLNIPAFSRGNNLSLKAVKRSRNIASVIIHVERSIRRMKCFKILSGVIPIKLRFCLNQIITIVSVFSNLQKPLCV